MYKLICMSFDGEYKTEPYDFETIGETWGYSNDIGSKWFFYPFHFVVKGKTIKDAAFPLDTFIGKRIKTVERIFSKLAKKDEAQGMDSERFAFFVWDNI